MIYDKRNRATLDELAPNTKYKAYAWYEYCLKIGAEILIYDARRTLAEQEANVAKGVSKTMKSYHLVGQALDFVPIDASGKALWSLSSYSLPKIKQAIQYAKSLGFEWGGEWKSFVDAPHLQFNYKGYGTDKVLEVNKPKIIRYVTGGFPEGAASAKEFEDFMKSKNWWYKKEDAE